MPPPYPPIAVWMRLRAAEKVSAGGLTPVIERLVALLGGDCVRRDIEALA